MAESETRPPLPPFDRESAILKSGLQKMAGTLAMQKKFHWLTPLIPSGEIESTSQ